MPLSLSPLLLLIVFATFTCSPIRASPDMENNSTSSSGRHTVKHRQYWFKKCRGSGCPYTGSWLAHINLYKRVGWHLESTKMESASFNIFDRSQLKFQLSDPDAYYVHHMSMFEHLLHKKYGFEAASNASRAMSLAAFHGECKNETSIKAMHRGMGRDRAEYLTLVPFYGGLPPEVTSDFSKVNSIGQGNSLVDASIKVLQCMASVCSCLRYFGHVIVGVSREGDLKLLDDMLLQVDAKIRHHIHVVQFDMPKPAHLPFHLLAWGQQFVQKHNCGLRDELRAADAARAKKDEARAPAKHVSTDGDVFEICEDGDRLAEQHNGGPVNAIKFMNFNAFSRASNLDTPWIKDNITHHGTGDKKIRGRRQLSTSKSEPTSHQHKGDNGTNTHHRHSHPYKALKQLKPFRFVYYTEMDQIVRFDSVDTFRALSAASNSSCFFTGRRKEKERDSDELDYMGKLSQWRECGEPGYSLHWPAEIAVRATKLPA